MHRVELLRSSLRCDGLINLSKFKTHTFQVFSGATKNMFGLIPGLTKVGYHAKLADPNRFGDMLLDIAGLVRPRLNIVDAILAIEGTGPQHLGHAATHGVPCSPAPTPWPPTWPVARIAGIDPAAVPMLAAARTAGCGSGRPGDVAGRRGAA